MRADHFSQFGEGLGKEEGELGKVWEEVLGRYDIAVQHLVVDVLEETKSPVEKLAHALREMRTPESAQRAAEAVQKGL